ncbi:MAG TPA: hypothetical protein ENJ45_04360 [Phaeodactylibacter sp.]|nr:hypothetical protein [Phaeodactylibacter sp.]
MNKIAFLFFISFTLFTSCQKQTFKNIDVEEVLGTDYFPLHIGDWWVYQVDSIIYDLEKNKVLHDTIHTTVKLIITDTFSLGDDIQAFKVERFQRAFDSAPWKALDSWWAAKDEVGAWSNEGNLLFQKLTFPVKIGRRWEGNAHIGEHVSLMVHEDILEQVFDGWTYRYVALIQPEKIGEVSYDDVITVREVDNTLDAPPTIDYQKAYSKYAKGVGLVYKKWILLHDIDTSPDPSIPFADRAEEGFFLEQTLLEYHVQ